MLEPIRYEMPNGRTAHGFVSGTGPDIERVTVQHEMPDGSYAIEHVWVPVAPAPEPAAAPAPQAPVTEASQVSEDAA